MDWLRYVSLALAGISLVAATISLIFARKVHRITSANAARLKAEAERIEREFEESSADIRRGGRRTDHRFKLDA